MLEVQGFIGVDDSVGGMGGMGGFGKASQDEFEFIGVMSNIAHCKNALNISGAGGGLHVDLCVFHGEPPLGNGSQSRTEPEKGQ